ncbi:TPA: DUF4224 domain-containing protein [Burkholderia territorii]|uniref:DUF4224 domain-containing protein n=1 Tax=Burkholderia territorii TaxID=1503055 RepID=UPI0011CC5900|nr:DUF4224 domain-containing protein [Burkholderia territorii]TXG22083.1 DUF4224 domain-containing protein [Burkholderia territorii]HDR8859870.1 DUF4224 domain-containing protein [Burkholderia territorii]HDR8863684.1 DUF4224 domain-containing protein [Burkholderia territorii]HDR8868975.1 DUF4224 domain-containing protein [Burkholderia territorii]HDR8876191.1 DUF4224 domain-containing protein [Burkholderia territorii]
MSVLTNDELLELTGGLKQGAAQTRWIKKALGIDASRKADGHPMLTWEQVNQPRTTGAPRTQPKWRGAA